MGRSANAEQVAAEKHVNIAILQLKLAPRGVQRQLLHFALGFFPRFLSEFRIGVQAVKIARQRTFGFLFAADGGAGQDRRLLLKDDALPPLVKLHGLHILSQTVCVKMQKNNRGRDRPRQGARLRVLREKEWKMKKKSHRYSVRLLIFLYVLRKNYFAASARCNHTQPTSSAV